MIAGLHGRYLAGGTGLATACDLANGAEAVRMGVASRALPADVPEERVIEIAARVAEIPTDLPQLNERAVHRAMEIIGIREAIRSGTEIRALGVHQASAQEFSRKLAGSPPVPARLDRDGDFGECRAVRRGGGKRD